MSTCADVGSVIESKTTAVQTSNVGFTSEVSDYLVVRTGPGLREHPLTRFWSRSCRWRARKCAAESTGSWAPAERRTCASAAGDSCRTAACPSGSLPARPWRRGRWRRTSAARQPWHSWRRPGSSLGPENHRDWWAVVVVVGWLLHVPATC